MFVSSVASCSLEGLYVLFVGSFSPFGILISVLSGLSGCSPLSFQCTLCVLFCLMVTNVCLCLVCGSRTTVLMFETRLGDLDLLIL